MRRPLVLTTLTLCAFVFAVSTATAQTLDEATIKAQNAIYKQWWGTELEWRFAELPETAMVEKHRTPWAGHIYPDNAGGCTYVLRKYDQAFHRGRSFATDFERSDIAGQQRVSYRRSGLFGRRVVAVTVMPHWAGHCNGWAAAAIRHAEPKNSVTRNGVTFAPSDIKGLLAELYVYSNHELLGGEDGGAINPALFHVNLGNWLGLGDHPLAMDTTLGEEIWNYPIYSYKSSSYKHGDQGVEVTMNIGYVNSTNQEYDVAPKRFQFLYLHYYLELDADGKITGGSYYRDSNRIDLLWVPLQPTQGGEEGNKQGNPHLDVKEVLALWRDSVPEEYRKEWYNINPWPEDAIIDPDEEAAAEVADSSLDSEKLSETVEAESTAENAESTAENAESADENAESTTADAP